MKTQLDLMRAVARRLTGQEVIVKEDYTGYPVDDVGPVAGMVYPDVDNQGVIQLYQVPQTDYERAHVFLHECAHILRHVRMLPAGKYDPLTPATFSDPVKQAARDRVEAEAEALAEKWLQYAVEHTRSWERGNFGTLMWALLQAPKGDV
jgi:hypothetical protein